ncbi:MAG: gamma-glutamylcyclotransferase [Cytophagales bacterium]|nr:gamma-glutamylcyclotransferase [Cytophagales bacterium]
MPDLINKLFVYGTLGPGRPNEHWLTNIGGTFEEAYVRGRLYPDGWGATLGYPALVIDPEGDVVMGHVFSSDNLPDHWQELDDFEGEGYLRVLTEVTLNDGSILQAYFYSLSPAP